MARIDSRNRLREFQTRLAERLAHAKSAPVTASRLGFQINQERYLIDLSEAGEIVSAQDIVPVPHTHDWYRGLINVRGSLISAIDLSRFGGGAPTHVERESRIVLLSPTLDFNAGIIVTRMLGLHGTASWTQDTSAPANQHWQGALWRDEQNLPWRELSLAALTVNDQFLRISPL